MCILTLFIPCFLKVSFLYLHPASTEQICMVCPCQTQRVVIAIRYQSDNRLYDQINLDMKSIELATAVK